MNEWVRNQNEVTKNEELYKQQEITFINWIKRKKTLRAYAQIKQKTANKYEKKWKEITKQTKNFRIHWLTRKTKWKKKIYTSKRKNKWMSK